MLQPCLAGAQPRGNSRSDIGQQHHVLLAGVERNSSPVLLRIPGPPIAFSRLGEKLRGRQPRRLISSRYECHANDGVPKMTQRAQKLRVGAQVELAEHNTTTRARKYLHKRAGLTDRDEPATKPSDSRDLMPRRTIRVMIHERNASNPYWA
ncbi:hypothetical protein D9M68_897140 [compost metagenome]